MKKEFWYYMEQIQRRDPAEQIERDIVAAYIKWIPRAIIDEIEKAMETELIEHPYYPMYMVPAWKPNLKPEEKENITREVLLKITKPELVKKFKTNNPKATLFTIDAILKAIYRNKDIIQSWILTKYKELFQKKNESKK